MSPAPFVALIGAFLATASQGKSTNPFLTVSLLKQEVPVIRNNLTVVSKTAYYGNIFAGSPAKEFSVVFDTGSGHIILPSTSCPTATCRKHTQFDPSSSPGDNRTYMNPLVSVQFGTGQVKGVLSYQPVCFLNTDEYDEDDEDEVNETVGLGSPHDVCFEGSMLLANEMSEQPFDDFIFDGVLGLGLPGLAVEPEFSIWNMWNLEVVGLFISGTEGVQSELALGGHDTAHQAGEMNWVQVHQPELGYWQVKLQGVFVGGEEFEGCADGGCVAIIDSGTSTIGVPRSLGKGLFNKLSWKVEDPTADCREGEGVDISFRLPGLEGAFDVSLSRREYARISPMQGYMCAAAFLPMPVMDPPMSDRVFILGEPLLRKYYTAYAATKSQVGFAPSGRPSEYGVSI